MPQQRSPTTEGLVIRMGREDKYFVHWCWIAGNGTR
jgi:hypothetical protein